MLSGPPARSAGRGMQFYHTTGLDVLRQGGFSAIRGKRVGLVTHPAAVSCDSVNSAEVIASAPDSELVRLFGPEHGFTGEAQDLEGVAGGTRHPRLGVPIVSLYGDT